MTDYGGAVGEPYTIAGDTHSGSKAARLAVDGHQYMGLVTSLWGQTPIERSIEVDQTGTYTLSAFLKIDGKPGFVSYVDMTVSSTWSNAWVTWSAECRATYSRTASP